MKAQHFNCGKCGLEPEEWERTPDKELSDYRCPRCGKEHFHFKTDTTSELVPVDEEEREAQNIFITTTGRKVRGIEKVRNLLLEERNRKFCRRCGQTKSSDWKYSTDDQYDLVCPECGQRHLEDLKRLIPVDDRGNRMNVIEDAQGNRYLGEDEIQQGLNKIRKGGKE